VPRWSRLLLGVAGLVIATALVGAVVLLEEDPAHRGVQLGALLLGLLSLLGITLGVVGTIPYARAYLHRRRRLQQRRRRRAASPHARHLLFEDFEDDNEDNISSNGDVAPARARSSRRSLCEEEVGLLGAHALSDVDVHEVILGASLSEDQLSDLADVDQAVLLPSPEELAEWSDDPDEEDDHEDE
jgi:hypothetical protein